MDSELLKALDGFAGIAALVNGLILWPVVRSLKRDHAELRDMVRGYLDQLTRRKAKSRPAKRKR